VVWLCFLRGCVRAELRPGGVRRGAEDVFGGEVIRIQQEGHAIEAPGLRYLNRIPKADPLPSALLPPFSAPTLSLCFSPLQLLHTVRTSALCSQNMSGGAWGRECPRQGPPYHPNPIHSPATPSVQPSKQNRLILFGLTPSPPPPLWNYPLTYYIYAWTTVSGAGSDSGPLCTLAFILVTEDRLPAFKIAPRPPVSLFLYPCPLASDSTLPPLPPQPYAQIPTFRNSISSSPARAPHSTFYLVYQHQTTHMFPSPIITRPFVMSFSPSTV